MKYGHKAANWRIGQINGRSEHLIDEKPFNDLEVLDKTHIVSRITVWSDDTRLTGIRLSYKNGQDISHGNTENNNPMTFEFKSQEKTCIVGLESHPDASGNIWVDTVRMGTTHDVWTIEPSKRFKHNQRFEIKAPRPSGDDRWDLRGFYGSFDSKEQGFTQLGPIWGKENADEPAPATYSLFDEATWPSVENWPLCIVESMRSHHHRGENFRLSPLQGMLTSSSGVTFNALDAIDSDWKLERANFYFMESGESVILFGVSVDYTHGKQLQYGKCTPSARSIVSWEPGSMKEDRVVGVATSIKKNGASQYCLGLRLRLEREVDQPKPVEKKEAPAQEESKLKSSKDEGQGTREEKSQDGGDDDKGTTQVKAPTPPILSDFWITGDASLNHDGEPWSDISAVPSEKSGAKWSIKGFAGQAGTNGIEAIMVVWGREV